MKVTIHGAWNIPDGAKFDCRHVTMIHFTNQGMGVQQLMCGEKGMNSMEIVKMQRAFEMVARVTKESDVYKKAMKELKDHGINCEIDDSQTVSTTMEMEFESKEKRDDDEIKR